MGLMEEHYQLFAPVSYDVGEKKKSIQSSLLCVYALQFLAGYAIRKHRLMTIKLIRQIAKTYFSICFYPALIHKLPLNTN